MVSAFDRLSLTVSWEGTPTTWVQRERMKKTKYKLGSVWCKCSSAQTVTRDQLSTCFHCLPVGVGVFPRDSQHHCNIARAHATTCNHILNRRGIEAHNFELGSELQRWADGIQGPCPGGLVWVLFNMQSSRYHCPPTIVPLKISVRINARSQRAEGQTNSRYATI